MAVRLQRVAFGASVAVASIGLMALCGWIFDLPVLTSVISGAASMKVNTAVAFLIAGSSLALQVVPSSGRKRQLGLACGALVGVIGGLTLSQYLLGIDL